MPRFRFLLDVAAALYPHLPACTLRYLAQTRALILACRSPCGCWFLPLRYPACRYYPCYRSPFTAVLFATLPPHLRLACPIDVPHHHRLYLTLCCARQPAAAFRCLRTSPTLPPPAGRFRRPLLRVPTLYLPPHGADPLLPATAVGCALPALPLRCPLCLVGCRVRTVCPRSPFWGFYHCRTTLRRLPHFPCHHPFWGFASLPSLRCRLPRPLPARRYFTTVVIAHLGLNALLYTTAVALIGLLLRFAALTTAVRGGTRRLLLILFSLLFSSLISLVSRHALTIPQIHNSIRWKDLEGEDWRTWTGGNRQTTRQTKLVSHHTSHP